MLFETFRVLFGQRLRFLRQLANLTQARLAEGAGVSLEHVGKIERGVASPSMAVVMALARALETEPANLFLVTDSPLAAHPGDSADGATAIDWSRFITRIGTWEWTPLTGRFEWSDSMRRLLGREPGGLPPTRQALLGLVHPQDQARLLLALDQAEKGNPLDRLEIRVRHRPDSWRHLLIHLEVRTDEAGQPAIVRGTALDITEQKRLQQALLDTHASLEQRIRERTTRLREVIARLEGEIRERRQAQKALLESEERYRTVFDGAGDAIYVHDLAGRFIDANREAHERLGYGRDELLSMALADIDAATAAADAPDCAELIQDTGQAILEAEHRRKDGKLIQVEITARLIEYNGRPAVLSVARDISLHKAMAGELILAKRRAEEANQAKSRFLAAMSHEIRTPLNSLLGMLELAAMADDDEEREACLRTANDSAHSLLRIISDVLDLSRIEAGKTEIRSEIADPHQAMDFVSRLFAHQAAARGLVLETIISPTLPRALVCDCGRIKQILVNLVGNAVKFTDKGQVRLTAGMTRRCQDQALLLEVSDTGPGISRDVLQTLFEPFTRGARYDKTGVPGSGLGLSIVKGLVEALGGEVTVDSREGQGTTVCVILPVGLPEDRPEAPGAAAPGPAPAWVRLRVLVAEDEPVNRLTTVKLLERLGHEAVGVEDGNQALDALDGRPFDVVLMDVEMPGMGGLEAVRRIRDSRSSRARGLPVVAMTAHALKGDRERLMASGMDDYLSKPISLDSLASVLARVKPDS